MRVPFTCKWVCKYHVIKSI